LSKVLFWIVAVPLAAALVVFSVNNRADVVLDLWPLDKVTAPLPMFAVVMAALMVGFVGGAVAAWLGGAKVRGRARAEGRRAERAENDLQAAEEKIRRLEADAAVARGDVSSASSPERRQLPNAAA